MKQDSAQDSIMVESFKDSSYNNHLIILLVNHQGLTQMNLLKAIIIRELMLVEQLKILIQFLNSLINNSLRITHLIISMVIKTLTKYKH